MNREVLVVLGAGGIGQAIARRQGPGKSVLLADLNEDTLESPPRRWRRLATASPRNESMWRHTNR